MMTEKVKYCVHICELFKLPLSTKRIIFHEITKTAIQDAIKKPTTINMSLVMAQKQGKY